MRIKSLLTLVLVCCAIGLLYALASDRPVPVRCFQVTAHSTDSIPKRNPRSQGRRINPYPILLQKFFTRVWSGHIVCNGDTAKGSCELTITSKDSADVYVSGLLDSKTKVEAAIRGYMVIVEPQKIHTHKGEHTVQGTFILSNDYNSLTGKYTAEMKGKTDTCSVVLRPVK